jgi:hypothetical protein
MKLFSAHTKMYAIKAVSISSADTVLVGEDPAGVLERSVEVGL